MPVQKDSHESQTPQPTPPQQSPKPRPRPRPMPVEGNVKADVPPKEDRGQG